MVERPLAATLVALLVLGEQETGAHHVASDAGITPAQPRTIVELAFDGGTLNQGSVQGSYLRVSPALELGLHRRLSLRVHAAFVTLDPDEGATRRGPGDTEIAAKLNLIGGAHGGTLLSAGFGVKLPTGDASSGLGGGHLGLAPFVAGAWEQDVNGISLVVAALLVDMISVGADDHGAERPLALEPHGPHELSAVTTIALVAPRAWISLGATSTWAFGPPSGFEALAARALGGVRLTSRYRMLMSLEAPLIADPGYRWRSLVSFAYVR